MVLVVMYVGGGGGHNSGPELERCMTGREDATRATRDSCPCVEIRMTRVRTSKKAMDRVALDLRGKLEHTSKSLPANRGVDCRRHKEVFARLSSPVPIRALVPEDHGR